MYLTFKAEKHEITLIELQKQFNHDQIDILNIEIRRTKTFTLVVSRTGKSPSGLWNS